MIFLYVIGCAMALTSVIYAGILMHKNSEYSITGYLGSAMVCCAGFCVFPIINMFAAAWLFIEINDAVNKIEGKRK